MVRSSLWRWLLPPIMALLGGCCCALFGTARAGTPAYLYSLIPQNRHGPSRRYHKGSVCCKASAEAELQLFLQDAIERDPADTAAAAHLELGMQAKEKRDLSQAVVSLQHAIALMTPDNTDDTDSVKYDLGTIFADMGYVDQAEDIFRGLIEREDQKQQQQSRRRPTRAKLALANLLLDGRGQRSVAYSIFRDACYEDRWSPMAFLAGVAADSNNQHTAAMDFYTSCVSQNAADLDATLHLMISHLRLGGDDAAVSADQLRLRLPEYQQSSADYVLSTPVRFDPSMHYFTFDMIQLALENTQRMDDDKGLVLEFGVYHGKTIRMIASYFSSGGAGGHNPAVQVHGFDTFSGIPENWHLTPKNSYSTHGTLPQAPSNVEYHAGLFSDILPGFLDEHPGPIRFMNIDCDLYSSTKDVFDLVSDRVVPGTVIIFDEYIMNPHWKQDEYKAFQEAVCKHGWTYKYLGISLVTGQAVVQIQ